MSDIRTLWPSRDRYVSLIKPLAITSVLLTLVSLFAMLTDEVREGDTHPFDLYFANLALAARTRWPGLVETMRDISGLGGITVLALLTAGCLGFLSLVRRRQIALFAMSSVVSGSLVVTAIKHLVARARPDASLASAAFDGLSFPSGHASMSAVVYLTLGALVASTRDEGRERLYILGAAFLVTGLIGVSRVALGAHWTTDVLGGWLFGSAWAAVWLLAARHTFSKSPTTAPAS